ncbi:MAG: glycosyltransferase family 39 protein [Anaerolineae bacterium]|nr:glycosyltransferase family 39 protein [Anaerolineae bacterium]
MNFIASRNYTLPVILLAFVATSLAWNALIPPYENLDEIEHAEVARHIAVTGRLPVHGEAEAAGYHVRQEASQPPLYHFLAAGWMRVWGLPTTPPDSRPIPDTVVDCGLTPTFYNKATHAQNPYTDGLLGRDSLRALRGLRILSTLLQTLTVSGVWVLARRIFPAGPAPLLATVFVAFNPQFLLVAAGVNNDNAVTPLATWGLVLAHDLWRDGPSFKRALLFGVVSGLAALSKLSGLALVGLGGWALLARLVQRKTTLREFVAWSALIVLVAAALVAPWMARNLRLYGDPTALAPMLDIVGRREYPMDFNEMKLTLLSYWGQLPCSFYPRAVYWPFLLLVGAGVLAFVLSWRRFAPEQKIALGQAGLWFAVILAAWLRWNRITPSTGGRLLFPAIAAPALIFAGGIAQTLRRFPWHKRVVQITAALLAIGSLATLCAGPLRFFALPAQHPAGFVPPNPVAIVFGEDRVLRGYTARVRETPLACLLAAESYCDPSLDVTLYWQATKPAGADDVMALQLVSPVPGDTTLRLNYNHWPGRGNLPTSAWPVGPVLSDHYRIPLPESDLPAQGWNLNLAFFDADTQARLPVTRDGNVLGDAATLALLRVPGQALGLAETSNLAQFGENARLQGAQITAEGNVWRVTLLWESLAPLAEDYTVFVHAYAAGGEQLATGDGPPQAGHFPTHLWEPGDRIEDTHILNLPAGSAPAKIAVGLYHPSSGERLPATSAGAPLPDNAVVVWTATP